MPTKEEKKEYPLQATLDKYGLSRDEFNARLLAQGNKCPICGNTPSTGRWNIDHEHVKGWKKMPPEKRKLYVRGILCFFCNRYYMAKSMTALKAWNIIRYLENYGIQQK